MPALGMLVIPNWFILALYDLKPRGRLLLIKSLVVGKKQFSVNLIQGPLAGVSSAPFRKLTTRYSQPAFACTEMISCKTLIHQSDDFLRRFIYKDPEEKTLCFQLSGTDPMELSKAVSKATQLGADLIDLNCGCPVKKIRSRGAGSRLLSQPSRLYQLMIAMKQHTHLPVSIKIRVDGVSGDGFNRDIAKAVNDAGIDFLIVHGRHWDEHYETACRYDEIAFFVNEVNVPVIGNGDVACESSLQQMLKTGCAGAMIARAGVGQPWLIRKLMASMQGMAYQVPALKEIGAIFVEHIAGLAELMGGEKFALLHARALSKYYAKQVADKATFCLAVQHCESLAEFNQLVNKFY